MQCSLGLEGFLSGQRGQTVNLLAYAFGGSNPPPSTNKNDLINKIKEDKKHWKCFVRQYTEKKASLLKKLALRIYFSEQLIEYLEGFPSGQRGQTVNLLAYAFGGSNPPPSTTLIL